MTINHSFSIVKILYPKVSVIYLTIIRHILRFVHGLSMVCPWFVPIFRCYVRYIKDPIAIAIAPRCRFLSKVRLPNCCRSPVMLGITMPSPSSNSSTAACLKPLKRGCVFFGGGTPCIPGLWGIHGRIYGGRTWYNHIISYIYIYCTYNHKLG